MRLVIFDALERKLKIEIIMSEEVRCGWSRRSKVMHLHREGALSSVCGRQAVSSMRDDHSTRAGTDKVRLCPYCFAWAQGGLG